MGINGGQTHFNQVRTRTRGSVQWNVPLVTVTPFLTASNVREGELKSNTWQIPKSLYLGDPRSSGFYLKKSCFIIQYYFWRGGKPALLLRELLDWKRKSGQPHPRKRTGSCQQAVELLPAGICTPLIFFSYLFSGTWCEKWSEKWRKRASET